jgi:hypothetical protein
VVATSVGVHAHIVADFFWFDDYLHLYNVSNRPLWHALVEPNGGHLLIFYNAMWWALHSLFGTNASLYYATLLTVHGLCVWLLFAIIRRSTGHRLLAAFGALLWGMCPLDLGSLGWLSVLGHVTATAAILWVLLDMIDLREGDPPPSASTLARWYGLLLIASTSFGIGLAVAMTFGIAFFVWNPAPSQRLRLTAMLASLAVVVPLIYLGAGEMWVEGGGRPLRALPDADRIVPYWRGVASTLVQLHAYGFSGLALGPLLVGSHAVVSSHARVTVSLAVGAVGLLGLGLGFAASSAERRRQLVALVMISGAGYGAVAIARWWIQPTPYYERYHYLGPAIFSIALCLCIASLARERAWMERGGRALLATWICVMIVPYALSRPGGGKTRVRRLAAEREYTEAMSAIRSQIEAGPRGGVVHISNRPFDLHAKRDRDRRAGDFPGWAGLYIIKYPTDNALGRSVRFVERDAARLQQARSRTRERLARLLISEADDE